MALLGMALAGCNSNDDDDSSDSASDDSATTNSTSDAEDTTNTTATNTAATATNTVTAANVSLTGDWLFKHEVMTLRQNGASIQGSAVGSGAPDPVNPIESPVPVVGSVRSDGTVKLSELINFPLNPAMNFTIDKVGGLNGPNALVLQVIRGQKPQTQVWNRK